MIERTDGENSVKEKDYSREADLRPDVTKLPQGIELTNLLEDLNRMKNSSPNGKRLLPLYGGAVYYDLKTKSYKRDNS